LARTGFESKGAHCNGLRPVWDWPPGESDAMTPDQGYDRRLTGASVVPFPRECEGTVCGFVYNLNTT
jgi:hypothetical protein